jgi:hypothetical protein
MKNEWIQIEDRKHADTPKAAPEQLFNEQISEHEKQNVRKKHRQPQRERTVPEQIDASLAKYRIQDVNVCRDFRKLHVIAIRKPQVRAVRRFIDRQWNAEDADEVADEESKGKQAGD